MREFSDSEKKLLSHFVKCKRCGDRNKQITATIFREYNDFLRLSWSEEKGELIIYINNGENTETIANKLYFALVDYVMFLKELDNLGLAYYNSFGHADEHKRRELYDQALYKLDLNNNLCRHDGSQVGCVHYNYTINFIEILDLYLFQKSICPLPLMEDLVDNDFVSIDRRQFNEQMLWTRLSVIIALIAVLLSSVLELLE